MNWRTFWPELFEAFRGSTSSCTFCLNQIEDFDACFDHWWLVCFFIFFETMFPTYFNLNLLSYLAVSSRASHVGFFPIFFTYLSTLFDYECSTFGNFIKNVWKMLFFFYYISGLSIIQKVLLNIFSKADFWHTLWLTSSESCVQMSHSWGDRMLSRFR